MVSPILIGVGVLLVISVIVLFQLRKPSVIQTPLSSPQPRTVISKTILASEKNSVSEVAGALKRVASVKREETEEHVKSNKIRLAEWDTKKAAD